MGIALVTAWINTLIPRTQSNYACEVVATPVVRAPAPELGMVLPAEIAHLKAAPIIGLSAAPSFQAFHLAAQLYARSITIFAWKTAEENV